MVTEGCYYFFLLSDITRDTWYPCALIFIIPWLYSTPARTACSGNRHKVSTLFSDFIRVHMIDILVISTPMKSLNSDETWPLPRGPKVKIRPIPDNPKTIPNVRKSKRISNYALGNQRPRWKCWKYVIFGIFDTWLLSKGPKMKIRPIPDTYH